MPITSSVRSRPDKCPGVFRPWAATDGALVRLRLIGGRISPRSLLGLSQLAGRYADGNVHLTKNLPVLLCGEGADLKLGQEIGSAETARPLSDLHMEVFKLMGVDSVTSFGEGECLSTGQSLGILT